MLESLYQACRHPVPMTNGGQNAADEHSKSNGRREAQDLDLVMMVDGISASGSRQDS